MKNFSNDPSNFLQKMGSFYQRIPTFKVSVGDIFIGGDAPITVQSMTTTDTMDTEATVQQVLSLKNAGADIVRISAPSIRHAENLKNIRQELHRLGCTIPLVADIHFTPKAAELSAKIVEKVRINPGNYADKKNFQIKEYSEKDYSDELDRIYTKFSPFIKICKEYGTAMRIGSNHGSLSDRIMSRYGDTPLGMVESALEFVRMCEDHNYFQIVLSMKASNTQVMVRAYRLLMKEMLKRDFVYPLHLGVTEAGFGLDARLKSASGIGALLMDGIGDTVRVSLTEDPENEIPAARAIVDHCYGGGTDDGFDHKMEKNTRSMVEISDNSLNFSKRESVSYKNIGGQCLPVVLSEHPSADAVVCDCTKKDHLFCSSLETLEDSYRLYREILSMDHRGDKRPIIIDMRPFLTTALSMDCDIEFWREIQMACLLGPLLLDGLIDAVIVLNDETAVQNALALFQATRQRTVKTEYISCPSCARTLFDLQIVSERVRKKTGHLKNLKIAVMGCIVNGPGEMADADYGYVGSGVGKISLYRGKEVVLKNIDDSKAVDSLIDLIKSDECWTDPEV